MNFEEHLSSWLANEEIKDLISSINEKESKHAVLLNTNKIDDDLFLSLFPNVNPHPIVKHAYIYDKNEYDLGKNILHELGAYYLQEPSAMCVSHYLDAQPGDKVLDLCAAPGGKTVQTSLKIGNDGIIIANDLSKSRSGAILENAERLGLGNVVIANNDFSLIYKNYKNYFDKIILDAPCSGSGMFRKQSEIKDDWTYQKVLKFAEIQKELIEIAYFMLKEGGTLSYSTCSFSKEENEDVVQYLLNSTDAEIVEIKNELLISIGNGVLFLPSKFPGEGHYLCLIKKPGILIKKDASKIDYKPNKFISSINDKFVKRFGDTLFYLNGEIKTNGLNIVRYGVKLGEISGNVLKFDHHFASYTKVFDNEYEINLQNCIQYFDGQSLNIPTKNGFVLLKYNGINIDIAKSDGRIIKNRFPKYLRKKIS